MVICIALCGSQTSYGGLDFVLRDSLPGAPIPVQVRPLVGHDLVHLARDVPIDIRVLIFRESSGAPVGTEGKFDHAVDGFFGFDGH